ncbi:hypothetical protein Sj15T_10050 [Sphingobium sp. TA15]|nr:hypothetical protein Sj15T_10050 [Sphingobium sp. TA15]
MIAVDSQAYGTLARVDANQRGVAKTDRLVADHMERWTARQLQRRSEPARPRQGELGLGAPEPRPADRWQRAIAQAYQEIRAKIEMGDLDHNEITAGWIQEWAADIYTAEEGDDAQNP